MTAHEDIEALAALDAIGAASSEEQETLRAHLESCAECRTAHSEYVDAAAAFARDLDPVTPPAAVKAALVDYIGPTEEDATLDPSQDSTLREFVEPYRRDSRWWLATAASVFLALWAWRELAVRVAREHIKSRDAEIQTLTEQNAILTQRNEKLSGQLAALGGRDTKVIALAGQKIAPAASARVFLEPAKRRAVVFFANLPANAGDKSYQLWIIRADQAKPQSAGVFDASSTGSATISVENLPVDTEMKAMAVTVEPRGGMPQPTNANYVVMGKT